MRLTPESAPWQSYEGQFLIAMPSLRDGPFARSVVYMCAHREDGAMGIVINQRAEEIEFPRLLVQLDVVCLTATLDILKAIARGAGPSQAVLALGYAGWASGQLESEILANGWLVSPADSRLIFDADFDAIYDRALALIGVNAAWLSSDAGHA